MCGKLLALERIQIRGWLQSSSSQHLWSALMCKAEQLTRTVFPGSINESTTTWAKVSIAFCWVLMWKVVSLTVLVKHVDTNWANRSSNASFPPVVVSTHLRFGRENSRHKNSCLIKQRWKIVWANSEKVSLITRCNLSCQLLIKKVLLERKQGLTGLTQSNNHRDLEITPWWRIVFYH